MTTKLHRKLTDEETKMNLVERIGGARLVYGVMEAQRDNATYVYTCEFCGQTEHDPHLVGCTSKHAKVEL